MAEKEKKPDAAAKDEKKPAAKAEAAPAATPAAAAAKGGGFLTKLPVLMGGAMLIEAVVLFAGFKFLNGGAKNANAADLTTPVVKKEGGAEGADGEKAAPTDASTTAEIQLLEARFPNKRSGRTFLYDIKVVISVKKE